MKSNHQYHSIYRKNTTNGNIIIDVTLDDYSEYFHKWDNSAMQQRDMNPELAGFLDFCSKDIPLRENIEIHFLVKTNVISKEKEQLIRASYKNYYTSLYRWEREEERRVSKHSGILLLTGLLLLFLHGVFSDKTQNRIISVIFQSLLIGGWIFTWESISAIALDIKGPFRRRKELLRFFNASILFKYPQDPRS